MERRKFVIGLGALASGTAAAVGTGAFDSVEAQREVQVSTAGDKDAYLGLTGDDVYVTDDSDDDGLTIDLGGGPGTDAGGQGLNENAVTELSGVVTIRNQGTDDTTVDVTIDQDGVQSAIDFSLSGDTALTPGDSVDLDVTVDDLDDSVDEDADDNLVITAE